MNAPKEKLAAADSAAAATTFTANSSQKPRKPHSNAQVSTTNNPSNSNQPPIKHQQQNKFLDDRHQNSNMNVQGGQSTTSQSVQHNQPKQASQMNTQSNSQQRPNHQNGGGQQHQQQGNLFPRNQFQGGSGSGGSGGSSSGGGSGQLQQQQQHHQQQQHSNNTSQNSPQNNRPANNLKKNHNSQVQGGINQSNSGSTQPHLNTGNQKQPKSQYTRKTEPKQQMIFMLKEQPQETSEIIVQKSNAEVAIDSRPNGQETAQSLTKQKEETMQTQAKVNEKVRDNSTEQKAAVTEKVAEASNKEVKETEDISAVKPVFSDQPEMHQEVANDLVGHLSKVEEEQKNKHPIEVQQSGQSTEEQQQPVQDYSTQSTQQLGEQQQVPFIAKETEGELKEENFTTGSQDEKQLETIVDPMALIPLEIVRFSCEWGLWMCFSSEQHTSKHQNAKTFLQNNQIVFNFNSLRELCLILQNSRLSCISNFFTFRSIRRFQQDADENNMRMIDAISFFKSGIKPTWEDKRNACGQDLQTKFNGASAAQIDQIYFFLLCHLFSEEFPFMDQLNGFRFADKGNVKKSNVRLEIWFDLLSEKQAEDIHEYFTSLLHTQWSNPVFAWKNRNVCFNLVLPFHPPPPYRRRLPCAFILLAFVQARTKRNPPLKSSSEFPSCSYSRSRIPHPFSTLWVGGRRLLWF